MRGDLDAAAAGMEVIYRRSSAALTLCMVLGVAIRMPSLPSLANSNAPAPRLEVRIRIFLARDGYPMSPGRAWR